MARLPAPFASLRALRSGDPFSELHRQMNQLFDDFVGPSPSSMAAAPRMDLRETDQELCVSAELPGVKPSDVDLRIDGNLLTLRGEKKDESEQSQAGWHLAERSWGQFQRAIQLPFAPDPAQVRADFEHGVLTVHLPKQPQQERSRRIEVHAPGQTLEAQGMQARPQEGAASGQPAQAQGPQGAGGPVHH